MYEQELIEEERKTRPRPAAFQEAQEKLSQFYFQQKMLWEEAPYSKADIQRYFSETYLSALSLPDYVLLLRRFPSHMVTHVIRQGIRDHHGHEWHKGRLAEYSDGFLQVLKDGRLKSALAIYFKDGLNKESVRSF